jgi:hypothetical protein
MTGRKTLAEVRAELKATLGSGPAGSDELAKSLRRFLARTGDEASAEGEIRAPATGEAAPSPIAEPAR